MSVRSRGAGGRWRPVALVGAALLVGSTIPVPARYNPATGPFGPDKFLHAAGHAAFAGAIVAACEGRSRLRVAVAAVVVSTVYGVLTETLQESIPGREFERGDVVAGVVGSVAGVAFPALPRGRRPSLSRTPGAVRR